MAISIVRRVHCSILPPYTDNYIDGMTFLQLEEQDIRELIPGAVGIVKKLLRLIPKVATTCIMA